MDFANPGFMNFYLDFHLTGVGNRDNALSFTYLGANLNQLPRPLSGIEHAGAVNDLSGHRGLYNACFVLCLIFFKSFVLQVKCCFFVSQLCLFLRKPGACPGLCPVKLSCSLVVICKQFLRPLGKSIQFEQL